MDYIVFLSNERSKIMVRRNKENVIFDDDATVIIQRDEMPTHTERKMIQKQAEKFNEPISVVDVLDTIAGYVMPSFYMVPDSEESGQCLLCGKRTAYKMRKLCVDCMKEHSREYYEKARAAIQAGEDTIRM